MQTFYFVLAFLVGVGTSVQSGINSQLRASTGNSIFAAIASFTCGLLALCFYYLFFNRSPHPTLQTLQNTTWWHWTGGLLGAAFVLGIITVVKDIGAANAIGLAVAGQLLAAVVLDHFGLVGFVVHPLNAWRGLGVLLMAGGAYLVLKN